MAVCFEAFCKLPTRPHTRHHCRLCNTPALRHEPGCDSTGLGVNIQHELNIGQHGCPPACRVELSGCSLIAFVTSARDVSRTSTTEQPLVARRLTGTTSLDFATATSLNSNVSSDRRGTTRPQPSPLGPRIRNVSPRQFRSRVRVDNICCP